MNPLLHRDRDEDVEDTTSSYGAPYGKDREITLGTTMILGIFFALAVFAAVFFGFGYSMGAKHAAGTTTASADGGSSALFNNFKPAPGSPLGGSGRPAPIVNESPALTPTVSTVRVAVPKVSSEDFVPPATQPAAETANEPGVPAVRPIPRSALAAYVAPATPATATPVAAPAPGASVLMVQVAAVSHQEDADLLVTTLKRRGYAVAVHTEPQDKLLHVQIGPFGNRADANAMRQRLLGDGFNAIVK